MLQEEYGKNNPGKIKVKGKVDIMLAATTKRKVTKKTYAMKERGRYYWYRDVNGNKYRNRKGTNNWKIVKGTLADFIKFLEREGL